MTTFDTVVRHAVVATAADVFEADIGITGGVVTALGRELGPARRDVDAAGRWVLPGGIDTHCHLDHNCDYTPYEGMQIRGWPAVVFSRGEIVVEDGKLLAEPGQGQFLRCDRPALARSRRR